MFFTYHGRGTGQRSRPRARIHPYENSPDTQESESKSFYLNFLADYGFMVIDIKTNV